MLLPSDRHRPADLALWAEMEAADRLHYRAASVAAKAGRSADAIREFIAAGSCYGAVSWGKDSMVLAHLIATVCPHLPVGRVDQTGPGADLYVPAVRDAFLARFPLDYHEEAVGLVAIPDDGGHSPALDIGISLLRHRFGTDRYVGGIRADESGIRKIGLRTRGLTTDRTCQPLGWWTVADVFAYLAVYDLPVHPSYAMLGGGRWDRARIRVSTIGGPKGNQFGRAEWEREYYGDVLRRMEAR